MSLLKDLVILDPNSSKFKHVVQPMKMERLVGGLTQVFLKRRDWTASVGCKADTGWDKWLQSWSLCVAAAEPPWNSLYSKMMSISTSCSSHVSFERSGHDWTNSELICKQANEVRAMWDAQLKAVLRKQDWNKFESLNAYCVRLYALFLRTICLFETGEFRERLHAQSAQVNSCSEMPEILDLLDFALGLRQLRICRKLQEVEGIA